MAYLIGMAERKCSVRFVAFVAIIKRFEATFLPVVTSGHLHIAGHSLRCLDVEIRHCFVDNNDGDDRTDYFTPCECAWGKEENVNLCILLPVLPYPCIQLLEWTLVLCV